MKNILSYKVVGNVVNPEMDGSYFISHRVSKNHRDRLESVLREEQEVQKKSTLSKKEGTFRYVLCLGVVAVFGSFATSDVTFQEFITEGKMIFLLGIALFVAALGMFVWGRFKGKRRSVIEARAKIEADKSRLAEVSKKELKVPANAEQVDILAYFYEINKKGKEVHKNPNDVDFVNTLYYIYQKDNAMCLTNNYQELTFQPDLIRRIEKVNKGASLLSWNKEEDVRSEKYKPYNLRKNASDFVCLKYYYRIVLGKNADKYEIDIPEYELSTVQKYLPASIEVVE